MVIGVPRCGLQLTQLANVGIWALRTLVAGPSDGVNLTDLTFVTEMYGVAFLELLTLVILDKELRKPCKDILFSKHGNLNLLMLTDVLHRVMLDRTFWIMLWDPLYFLLMSAAPFFLFFIILCEADNLCALSSEFELIIGECIVDPLCVLVLLILLLVSSLLLEDNHLLLRRVLIRLLLVVTTTSASVDHS